MKMKRQKRIICLCLILAMFVTILPCEVKAQGKKTWGEAYEEVLKKYGSDATAKLIYLDNDNIPEVYVDNGEVVLLSYYNGKVYKNYRNDGVDLCSYVPKQGKIVFTSVGKGADTAIAKLKKGKLKWIFFGNTVGIESFAYVPKNKMADKKEWIENLKFVSEKQYSKKYSAAAGNLLTKKTKTIYSDKLLSLNTVRHQIKKLSGTNMDVNNDGKYENVRFIKKRDGHHLSILINGKKVLDKKGYYANAYLKQYNFSNNSYLCLKIMNEDDITRFFSFYQYKDGKLQKIYDLQKTFLPNGYGGKDAVEFKVKQEANRLLIDLEWNTRALGFVRTKYNVICNQGKFKRESPIYEIVSYGSDKSVALPYLSLKRNIKLYSSYDMKMQIADIKKGEKICFTNVYMKGNDVFLKATTASGITGWFKVELNKKYFSNHDIVQGG